MNEVCRRAAIGDADGGQPITRIERNTCRLDDLRGRGHARDAAASARGGVHSLAHAFGDLHQRFRGG